MLANQTGPARHDLAGPAYSMKDLMGWAGQEMTRPDSITSFEWVAQAGNSQRTYRQ